MVVSRTSAIKAVLALVCFTLFAYQFSFICAQYFREETTSDVEFIRKKVRIKSHFTSATAQNIFCKQEVGFPSFTVCAQQGYKNAKVELNSDESKFIANTYDRDELFPPRSSDAWNVSETRSGRYGRCYTFVAPGRKVRAFSMAETFGLIPGMDVVVFSKSGHCLHSVYLIPLAYLTQFTIPAKNFGYGRSSPPLSSTPREWRPEARGTFT